MSNETATSSTNESTRLILSNLPPSLTEGLLKSHLARCPPAPPSLTDLKILRKPDGTSRRIAFLGFKDTPEANRTLRWLDGSYVQGTTSGARVKADWAKETHEAPRPRKRIRVSPPPKSTPSKSSNALKGGSQFDKDRFAEFMSVMAPQRNRAVEDQSIFELVPPSVSGVVEEEQHEVCSPLPRAGTDHPMATASPANVMTSVAVRHNDTTTDGAADDDSLTDVEYMAKRMKRAIVEVDSEDEDADVTGPTAGSVTEVTAEQDSQDPVLIRSTLHELAGKYRNSDKQLIQETGRLFLRNLAFTATEDELRCLMEPYGALEKVHIPTDKSSQSPKGTAYITFASASAAIAAFEDLDGRSFQGRLLHILPAAGRRKSELDGNSHTVKAQRLQTRKRDAGSSLSWSTLYMNSDAVMSSVAARLDLSKADLLDPSTDNAAVRLALAEAHVITETKQFFESQGVNLDSLSVAGPRSPTTMLVKNIPFGTSAAALMALFSPFGSVRQLLLPPAGTIAIVEMGDEPSAADAWRGLVYKKLGNSLLYLEKAAAGIWMGSSKPKNQGGRPDPLSESLSGSQPDSTQNNAAEGEPGSTLFIKNLSFQTTTAGLADVFSQLPDFLFARVQNKPDTKNPGRTLSMGFGFVGFRTVAAASAALKARDRCLLDGHQLEVRFAQRGRESTTTQAGPTHKSAKATSNKLIVKNVPFEVSRKEIRELFGAYGQLKSVRLPRKFDHKTRGFAFLEYVSRQDAEAAFQALEHTHLLGRHLVLQWAEEGDVQVEALRAKTSFTEGKVPGQKAKFTLGDSA